MITLEKYDLKFIDDFVEYIKEFQEHGDEFVVMNIIDTAMKTFGMDGTWIDLKGEQIPDFFKKYIKFIDNLSSIETIPVKGWVEGEEYAICKDGKMIGRVNFRKALNKYLLLHSLGHIGYAIKHSERGNGYATTALKLMLDKVWEMGYGEVMISCNDRNFASRQVIEKNGGVLNRANMINPEEPEREYWIFNTKYQK